MKKSLLIAAMAFAGVSAFAQNQIAYPEVNDVKCESQWLASTWTNSDNYFKYSFSGDGAARTASLGQYQGKDVVLVNTFNYPIEGSAYVGTSVITILDFMTGELIKEVQLTLDGEPVSGYGYNNTVGCDNFGHVWVAPLKLNLFNFTDEIFADVIFYTVDLETGALTQALSCQITESDVDVLMENVGRVDYFDLVGDITRQEAGCNITFAVSSGAALTVGNWTAEQGGEFIGGWNSGDNALMNIPAEAGGEPNVYPAATANWGTAPYTRAVLDDNFSADLVYVDGFSTTPALYSHEGTMIDSFLTLAGTDKAELIPNTGTNGVGEFALGGKNFIVYSVNQYVSPGYCAINVCAVGDDMTFDSMERYWELPTLEGGKVGLGETSDGGLRVHPIHTKVYADEEGNEGAYLLTYKCKNGIGVYAIADKEFDAVNDIVADSKDNNAPVEYFNLNGVRMNGNNLPAGLYITRQGNTVNKVVVK